MKNLTQAAVTAAQTNEEDVTMEDQIRNNKGLASKGETAMAADADMEKALKEFRIVSKMLESDRAYPFMGPTGAGKSTGFAEQAADPDVGLTLNEVLTGSGCSTRSAMRISVINEDFGIISADELLLVITLNNIKEIIQKYGFDYIMNVLYEVCRRCSHLRTETNNDKIREEVSKAVVSYHKAAKSNLDYLTYIKACCGGSVPEALIEAFTKVIVENFQLLMAHYSETEALKDAQPSEKLRLFTNNLNESRKQFAEDIFGKLYDEQTAAFNIALSKIVDMITENGGVFDPEDTNRFYVRVKAINFDNETDEDTAKRELFETLIGHDEKSCDFLFSKIHIVFCGKMFRNRYSREIEDKIAPSYYYEAKGKFLKCITYEDTQGWFHKDDEKTSDIAYNAASTIRKCNASTAFIVLSLSDGAGLKKGEDVINEMIKYLDGYNVKLRLMFTHIDEAVDRKVEEAARRRRKLEADSNARAISELNAQISEITNGFNDTISRNRSKTVTLPEPIVYGVAYRDVCKELKDNYNFDVQMDKFFSELKTQKPCSIANSALEDFLERGLENKVYTINALNFNLANILIELFELINKRFYHYNTIYTTVGNLCSGNPHISNAKVYDNINTSQLVNLLRGYMANARKEIGDVTSQITPEFNNENDPDSKRSFHDNILFGASAYALNEFIKLLAKDARENGFCSAQNCYAEANVRFEAFVNRMRFVMCGSDSDNVRLINSFISKAYMTALVNEIRRYAVIVY